MLAAKAVEQRLASGEEMVIAAPALVESYAVLTRFPPPYRLAPSDALALLESNFIDGARVITLDGKGYRALLRHAPTEGIVGGRTYDAVIATCALQAKATVLLTFNQRHFAAFAEKGLTIAVP